jgi:glycosyltransferase involved in cell wall biosynthesis
VSAVREPISVVVPTRDRPERLRVALGALRASLGEADELIVVDSASADPTATASIANEFGARLERSERPGASTARNIGWRLSTHTYVGFLDDDVSVDPSWADALSGCLTAYPDAAFVTGRLGIAEHTGTMTVAVKDDAVAATIGRLDGGVIGHSASLGVRRSVLESVGGFDESLGAGARWRAAEDTDLFDRILAAGMTGRYEPSMQATHEQWRRIREWVVLQHSYGVGSGARLSKLWRLDRGRWRVIARDDLCTWGVAQLPGELARRDWYRAIGTVFRLAGMVRGFLAAAVTQVRNGQFQTSRESRSSS